jgi:hypothetical protein
VETEEVHTNFQVEDALGPRNPEHLLGLSELDREFLSLEMFPLPSLYELSMSPLSVGADFELVSLGVNQDNGIEDEILR